MLNFYLEHVLNFIKCFICLCGNDHMIFLYFINMVNFMDYLEKIYGLVNMATVLHFCNKFNLIMMN